MVEVCVSPTRVMVEVVLSNKRTDGRGNFL